MTKMRERARVRLLGVTGRKRSDLLISTALQATTLLVVGLPAWAQPAPNAMPSGGSVMAGIATITQTTGKTTIDQASQRAAINWQSFNVGSQRQVKFNQPSTSAIALNRVTGPDPSQIAGRIDANGQVVLINQAGVTFYKGAQVNAQSLIVTSANVSDAKFMAGNMAFDQAGNPNARVANHGTITVHQAGLAALVAPRVANSGVIDAKLGHVVLAGVKTATLDLYGDGLLALDVNNQVTQAPVGAGGKPVAALVTNSGVIRADGGTVQLTAAAADGVLQNLVRAGGTISANSVGARTGTVTVAGIGGSVTVTGLVSASGRAPGTMGGQVEVNATGNVVLAATARIDASGNAGGGTVAIGTTLQRANGGPGAPATMTAANVAVRKGARIAASATGTGKGGRVTVLSGDTTWMDGSIVAKGGPQAGDGGFVEVSGPRLGLTGMVDVSAPSGKFGTILLDPTNLDIIGTSPGNVDGEFAGNTLPSGAPDGSPPPSTVSASKIENLGTFGDVVIQASGNIDVQAAVSVLNGLTVQAGGNLTTEFGASLQAAGIILLQAGTTTPGGGIAINANVTSSGSNLNLIQLVAGTGGITLKGNLVATTVDLNATGGGVTQTTSFGITATNLKSSNGVTGTVSLLGANNVTTLNAFTVTAPGAGRADFLMKNTAALLVAGQLSTPSGDVYLQTSNPSGIAIANSGGVTTRAAGVASFQTDQFAIFSRSTAAVMVNTGTFELAPNNTSQPVSLGSFASALSLPTLAHIVATDIRIGAVTQPGVLGGPVTTAPAINVGGTFDVLNRNLELDAGTITGTAGPLVNVATLSGTGGAWLLNNANNTIANIGNVSASSFVLTDNEALTVAGALISAGTVTIADTGTLTVAGTVNGGGIALTAGDIAIPGLVSSGGVVDLIANAGTISETGTLIAGTLAGSAIGVADLLGKDAFVNQVATLGAGGFNFTASSFALRDGAGLTVAGTVTANGVTGQAFLESTAPAGITIASTGSVQGTSLTSLLTDRLADNGVVSADTIELAPATAGGTVTMGVADAGLSVLTKGLVFNNMVVGAVTPPTGGAPVITAGSIAINGSFAFAGKGTLTLEAASSTAPGATGSVTQSAPLTGVSVLSGTADSISLTNPGNAIDQLFSLTATAGDLNVVSKAQLSAAAVSAPLGNVYLESANLTGVLLTGPVTAKGRVGIQADALGSSAGSVSADIFELAPFTAGNTVTLGFAAGGLSLLSSGAVAITANTLRVGAVTLPGDTAPTTTAGAVTVAGVFGDAAIPTLALDAAAIGGGTGAISQSAPLVNIATLAATGSSVTLTDTGNQIATSSGIAATAGGVALVDSTSLALNGAYRGGNLFFEVATKGGSLTIGASGPATLTAGAGARISLVADALSANVAGSIGNAGGTVELAPFSAINVSLAGRGGMPISAALLADINVGGGTLVVGGFTDVAGSGALTTTAASITLDGAVDLTGRAGTLELLANGSVTEPGGPLTVGTVTGVAGGGDFSLSNGANQIQASTGITAFGGDVVLADDPTLLLTGLYSGTNLFFQVTLPGGSLALGDVKTAATLVAATNRRISLVADSMTATAASTITAPAGTLEVAPFSAINESVLGIGLPGQLLVDATLLSDISGGSNALATLSIGGYTNARAGGFRTISANGVTLDGALDLTGRATSLELLSNGSVTEPGGPATVTNVFGSSVGTFSLANPANAIAQGLNIAATKGDVVLVDGANLALFGTQSGNNLFFEVASKGGTLRLGNGLSPTAVTAASGGRITLVADQMTESGNSVLTAPGGTVELAPFSAINTSLLGGSATGQLLIDPTMLSIITPGISTLVVGGFTNVAAGATGSTPSAGSVTVDATVTLAPIATTLNLEASGAVSQTAPIVNVGTLLGTTGSTALSNPNNTVGTLGDYIASNGFALTNATNLLIAGTVVAGPGANFTVNGALTETGGLTANRLSGSAIGTASLTGNNRVAELDSFGVSGNSSSFALNDTGNLLINGSLSATRIVVSDPSSRVSLADGTSIVTGGSTRPSGLIAPSSLLPQNGAPGAWLQAASFVQTGHATVTGLGGGPSSLQISVTGNMQFGSPLGLSATGTWLTLNLTNGSAAGDVFIKALDVSYGQPGGTNLFGTINGVIGPTAASLGFIQPAPNLRFLFNNCEIGTPVCLITSLTLPRLLTETAMFVPLDALLALVTPALVLDPEDKDDLLQMPVVSREDY